MAAQIHISATSSPIARHVLQGSAQKVIPGCSATEHDGKGPVLVSNTMLQAYNKMRGPASSSQEDPLFEWIHLREDICSRDGKLAQSRSKRDIVHMLRKVDETLSEGNAAGDSPREAVFEINRPVAADHHIRAPLRHDFSTHLLTVSCADFEFESEDSDDEESSVPHGRISPCTFLAWSKGCQRWSGDNIKVPIDQNQPRRRPPTPEVVDTPPMLPRPFRYHGWDVERQIDANTGYELSPCYAVPTSPSLMYVAEGVDALRNQDPTTFEGRYSRMDPVAGKSLRKLVFYRRPNAPSGTPTASPTMEDAGVDEYGHSEVEALLSSPTVRHPLTQAPGFPSPSQLGEQLGQAYAAIAAHEAQTENLTQLLRYQTGQIRDLREEREHLSAAVGIIQSRRWRQQEEQEQKREQEKKARRRRGAEEEDPEKRQKRIHKHVAAHLEDVHYKYVRSADTLGQERMRKEANDAAIARLEMDLAELCYEAGLDSPAEVYDELTGRNSPDQDDGTAEAVASSSSSSSSCEKKEMKKRKTCLHHNHNGNNNDKINSNHQERGHGGGSNSSRSHTGNNPFPLLSPLLVTTNRALDQIPTVTTPPHDKSVHTPSRQRRSSTSPPSSPRRLMPLVRAGAFFSSPLPHHQPQNGGELEDDPLPRLKEQYLDMVMMSTTKDHDDNDYAEYEAVEKKLLAVEAYLARLQQR